MKYLLGNRETFLDTCEENSNDLLSADGGSKALGAGFRIWVKSKFNDSQKAAINAAAREYGSGGFTLVKGPPGTGKVSD
jgi:senataxin